MHKVESVEQLKQECTSEAHDFFILLNFNLKSSKRIWWNGERFLIKNYIDDTEQQVTEKELATETNIMKAIAKGAFYRE